MVELYLGGKRPQPPPPPHQYASYNSARIYTAKFGLNEKKSFCEFLFNDFIDLKIQFILLSFPVNLPEFLPECLPAFWANSSRILQNFW